MVNMDKRTVHGTFIAFENKSLQLYFNKWANACFQNTLLFCLPTDFLLSVDPLWHALIARNKATPLILSSASHCQFQYLTHGKVYSE